MKNKELIKQSFEVMKKITPIQLSYTNESDEIQKVCAFEIFNKNNEGVRVQNTTGNNTSIEFLKKYFYDNPHLSCLVRLQSTNLVGRQAENPIYLVSKNPMGSTYSRPIIIPVDSFSKHQFQSGIMDVQCSFVLDGLTNDLEFNLLPKSTIVFTVFFSECLKDRNRKKLNELFTKQKLNNEVKYLGSVVIENNSSEPKEIILFDLEKYKSDYVMQPNLRIFDLFSINYQDICSRFQNNCYEFNSIRIFVTAGSTDDKHKQCLQPIEFNSGSKYYPSVEIDGNEFQSGINDIFIIGEELSSDNQMKITVMPNTCVVYLFKQVEGIIKPTTTSNSFMSIEVENLSTESKKVNLLSSEIIKGVRHSIGKNKLALTENDFKPNLIRFQLYNQLHAEKPILIKSEDSKGVVTTKDIFPICFIDENSFNGNVITMPFDFDFPLKETQILVDLESKGDGMSVILLKGNVNNELGAINGNIINKIINKPHDFHLFPIWIENITDNTIDFELVNCVNDLKDLPEGIKCHVGVSDSLSIFLSRTESQKFDSLDIVKLYSNNTPQITQLFTLIDSTDPENPISIPFNSTNYFSANQFQNCLLSLGNSIKLDLKREEDGIDKQTDGSGNNYETLKTKISKKQKLVFKILGKSKLALICNLKKSV